MDTQLEEMRQQMAILKQKLEKQEIVNDRMIRRLIKKNVVGVNRTYLWLSILCIVMIPYCYWAFVTLSGFSVAFWIATSIFLLGAFLYTYFNGKDLRDSHLMQEDMLEVRRKVARAKKLDHDWLYIGIPFLILWIGWFAYEVYKKGGAEEVTTFLLAGTVGGIVGAIIGLSVHFRTQRQYKEIINQIEELQE